MKFNREEVLEPSLPILDAHHHLYDKPGLKYLLPDLVADFADGHRIFASCFVECMSMYRASGPEALRPLGETEFANGVAAMSASGNYGPTHICAGIVPFADLRLGAAVADVLDAHARVAGERFKGIRHLSTWDADDGMYQYVSRRFGRELLYDRKFREGLALLAPRGLVYESVLYFHQIPDLVALAAAFPDTMMILNHIGFPIGVGPYENRKDEVYAHWLANISALARCPNVMVKLGGLGMPMMGFGFHLRDAEASSDELASAWAPYYGKCIELFGAHRCMFESNFPMDAKSCSFRTLWNAFKRIASGASSDEKRDLFAGTAARAYRIELPSADVDSTMRRRNSRASGDR